jgi:hypothetical protein
MKEYQLLIGLILVALAILIGSKELKTEFESCVDEGIASSKSKSPKMSENIWKKCLIAYGRQ